MAMLLPAAPIAMPRPARAIGRRIVDAIAHHRDRAVAVGKAADLGYLILGKHVNVRSESARGLWSARTG
jgi:hypothetical protein